MAPKPHGVGEHAGLFFGIERRAGAGPLFHFAEHERGGFALVERELGQSRSGVFLQRNAGCETKTKRWRFEYRAFRHDFDCVLIERVVERGMAFQAEAHRSPNGAYATHQVMANGADDFNRHEVGNLGNPRAAVEPGDENVGVRPIKLLARDHLLDGRDLESAALLVVQNCSEHAGRIESRHAKPVDGSLDADQGNGVEIPNYAVVFDGLIGHQPNWRL